MAPSIYEYQSHAEWEQAMREWAAENEPYWKLMAYDWDTDEWRATRYDNEAEAVAALDRARAEWRKHDTWFRRPSLEFTSDGLMGHCRSRYDDPTKPEIYGRTPSHSHFSPENLPGGTYSEYRTLGLI